MFNKISKRQNQNLKFARTWALQNPKIVNQSNMRIVEEKEANDSDSWTLLQNHQQNLDHVSTNAQKLSSTHRGNKYIKLEKNEEMELKTKVDEGIKELEAKLLDLLVARQKPRRRRPKFGVIKLFGTAVAIAYLFLYLPLIPKENTLKVAKNRIQKHSNTSASRVFFVDENQTAFENNPLEPNNYSALEAKTPIMQLRNTIGSFLVDILLLHLACKAFRRLINRSNPQLTRETHIPLLEQDSFDRQVLKNEKGDTTDHDSMDTKESCHEVSNKRCASFNSNQNHILLWEKSPSSCGGRIPLKYKGEAEEKVTKSSSEVLRKAKAAYWRRLGEYWCKRKEYLEKRIEFMKDVGENIRKIMLQHEENTKKTPGRSVGVETLKNIVNEAVTVFRPNQNLDKNDLNNSTALDEIVTVLKGNNLKKKLCEKVMESKRYGNGRIEKGCKYPVRNLYYYFCDRTGGGF